MAYRRDPVPENLDDIRRYIDSELRKLEDETDAIEGYLSEAVIAGYGGAVQNAIIGFNIPASPDWITLPFDTLSPVEQKGFVFNLTLDSFRFEINGVWRLNISFSIRNIFETAATRVFNVRLFNITQGVAVDAVAVPVSDGQGDIFFSTSFIVESSDTNDRFRIDLGNGEGISLGNLAAAHCQANNLTELKTII